MKDNFGKFFKMLLKHEGGFINHPEDPGGATNLGVTKRVMQEFLGRAVSMSEMKCLTFEDVQPVYKKLYVDKVFFYDTTSGLDWAALHWAVNGGTDGMAKTLQTIIGTKQDSAIGSKSLQALMNYDAAELRGRLHDTHQKLYEKLSLFKTFGKGLTSCN